MTAEVTKYFYDTMDKLRLENALDIVQYERRQTGWPLLTNYFQPLGVNCPTIVRT